MYDEEGFAELIWEPGAVDYEIYEKCIECLSSLGKALQAAFALLEDELRELMQLIADAAETLAELVTPKKHHTVLYSCKLPGRIRSHLIPWYTSGFQ